MYYATRVDSTSGIWFLNKALKGFANNFHDDDEILVCKKRPDKADHGYYYRVVDGKVKRHPKKAINVMWLKRDFGL